MSEELPAAKFGKLIEFFRQYERVAVAFSGGIDSTLTLYAAITALGVERVVALYALSTLNSAASIADARATFAGNFPAAVVLKEIEVTPLLWPEFVVNTEERCYLCKKRMYSVLGEAMAAEGCSILVDGTNLDDLLEQRPGLKAIREMQIGTPLAEAGLTKQEIRLIAQKEGLANYALPSNSCLATRIQHGRPIVEKTLRTIESAERFLHERGFPGCRVRLRDAFFLIEVQEKDFAAFVKGSNRIAVNTYFRSLQKWPVMLNLTGR